MTHPSNTSVTAQFGAGERGAATVSTEEYAARFWHLIASNDVRVLVDMRRVIKHDDGTETEYWDSASFGNEAAKALIAGHGREPVSDALQAIQFVMIEAAEGIRPISNNEANQIVAALSSAGYSIERRVPVTEYEACKEAAELAHEKTAMLRRVMEAKDPLHPETRRLVQDFAVALAEKLIKAQKKYGRKDDWRSNDWKSDCRAELLRHIGKGDPLDVAAYCAFMWHRGWSTKSALTTPVSHTSVKDGGGDDYSELIEILEEQGREGDGACEVAAKVIRKLSALVKAVGSEALTYEQLQSLFEKAARSVSNGRNGDIRRFYEGASEKDLRAARAALAHPGSGDAEPGAEGEQ